MLRKLRWFFSRQNMREKVRPLEIYLYANFVAWKYVVNFYYRKFRKANLIGNTKAGMMWEPLEGYKPWGFFKKHKDATSEEKSH